MRVLISGGSGLIGSALALSLNEQGHQVTILTRHPEPGRGLAGAAQAAWDGRTVGPWVEEVARADAVVNLAGENIGGRRWTEAHKENVRRSRVEAGQALVSAFQQAPRKPGVLVQSSAVGYYGPTGDEELTEEAPSGRDYMAGICREWEASTLAVEALGVRRVVIRTGIVLSKEAGALPPMLLQFRLFGGGSLGSGRQWLPWIHLQDEVEAITYLIMREAAQGVYNLCASQPMTNAGFGRVLGRVLRRPYWLPAPAFALRLVLGEMSTLVLDGQRAIPAHLLADGYHFRFPEAEPALRDTLKA